MLLLTFLSPIVVVTMRRCIFGNEIDIESKLAKFVPSHRKIIFPQGYHDYQDGERIR